MAKHRKSITKETRKVAMSLMAHPDDCEILAAGTLALLAKKGWEIHIVSMTPGDCGSMDDGPEVISDKRRKENAAAAKIIGATYHCLESRDLYVTFDEKTLRRALALTRHIGPTLMITHSLQCYMMDHEMTALIARSASFGYAAPNATTGPIHPGSRCPHLYYADPVEGVDVYGNRITPGTYVNISSTMATKTRMLKAHASQREWLMKFHGMDHYVHSMQEWGSIRGKEMGVKYAEAFRQHGGHPYPQDCILSRELGDLVKKA
jgi:LmbE family N-acetylglucosaminyl deacetylase